MSSLKSKFWRLQEPYSNNFFDGYFAGHNWANDEATKRELLNIFNAMLLIRDSGPVSEWPFTHRLLENIQLPELAQYSVIERFYFIIRPLEMGCCARAVTFMQSKMEELLDAMYANMFEGTSEANEKRPEWLMFGNKPHFANGFLFGAFHYWLDFGDAANQSGR